jgi:hypothetical protein
MKRGFVAPTVAELSAYAREIDFRGFNAQEFLDKYEMVGWVVGTSRTPMVSWKAAVRTWQRNQAVWSGKPKAEEADPALVEYARQVRERLAGGGVEIGRLYRKIEDAVGPGALERVKTMARRA